MGYKEQGYIKVKCKYFRFGKRPYNCSGVECEGDSYVLWTFHIINKQHLIEVE